MLVRNLSWIVVVAALLGACAPLRSQSGPLEESRFVGTWKAVVTGPGGRMEMKSTISADGRYRGQAVANGQPLPPETGTMKAGGGRWELTADGGRRDGGTYEFQGNDTYMGIGLGGAATWTRTPESEALAAPSPAAVPIVTLADWTAQMRELARLWQSDATLVNVRVWAPLDNGFAIPGGPGSASAMTFNFFSPGTRKGLSLSPSAFGPPHSMPGDGPVCEHYLPLPAKFPDLVDIFPAMRGEGVSVRVKEADLYVLAQEGKEPRVVWVLMLDHLGPPWAYDVTAGKSFSYKDVYGDYIAEQEVEFRGHLDRAKDFGPWWRHGEQVKVNNPAGIDFKAIRIRTNTQRLVGTVLVPQRWLKPEELAKLGEFTQIRMRPPPGVVFVEEGNGVGSESLLIEYLEGLYYSR